MSEGDVLNQSCVNYGQWSRKRLFVNPALKHKVPTLSQDFQLKTRTADVK